jgi:hypothetical protein
VKSGTFKSDISGTFVSDTSGTFGVIYSMWNTLMGQRLNPKPTNIPLSGAKAWRRTGTNFSIK